MNPICNRPAKYDSVKISGKPNPPMNQATIGNIYVATSQDRSPIRATAKVHIKKVK